MKRFISGPYRITFWLFLGWSPQLMKIFLFPLPRAPFRSTAEQSAGHRPEHGDAKLVAHLTDETSIAKPLLRSDRSVERLRLPPAEEVSTIRSRQMPERRPDSGLRYYNHAWQKSHPASPSYWR